MEATAQWLVMMNAIGALKHREAKQALNKWRAVLAEIAEQRAQTLPRGYQYGLLFRGLLAFAEEHDVAAFLVDLLRSMAARELGENKAVEWLPGDVSLDRGLQWAKNQSLKKHNQQLGFKHKIESIMHTGRHFS